MFEAIRWYLALTAVGAGGLLPAAVLFGRLHSRGVLYARPLGLLLVTYVVWLAAALGPLSYGTGLAVGVTVVLWLASASVAFLRPTLVLEVWERRRYLLAGEVLVIVLFALFVLVRAQTPDAQFTEKPSDLMVLTAVHEAESFPPRDPWYAGEQLSYYHLGHTAVDVTARLAAVDVGSAFNLGLAAAGALAGAAIFALAGDVLAFSRRNRRASIYIAGAVATTSLIFLATAEGGIELLSANGIGGERVWGWIGVDRLPPPAGATNGVPDGFWWWWRATRVVPGTITEFPAFSLILGDLHAHVLALPLAVLAVAVAATTFEGTTPLTWRRWLADPPLLVLSALLFAGLVMTNSWDGVLYGVVWFAAAVAVFVSVGWGLGGALFGAVRYLLPPTLVALVIAAPFLLTLQGGGRGIEFVTEAPVDPVRFAVVWLPLALPLIAAVLLLRPRVSEAGVSRGITLALLLLLGWVLAAVVSGDRTTLEFRGSNWLTLGALVLLSGVGGAASAAAYRDRNRGRAAWLGIVAITSALVLTAELVQVAVSFGSRWNAVFKFWYGGWVLLSIAGGVAIGEVIDRLPRRRAGLPVLAAVGVLAALYAGSLLYAPAATISRAREGQSVGLDGLAYLDTVDPARAEAARWAQANLGASDVLLEAVGKNYSTGNMVSAVSGVPTLLGWPGHQCDWRGDVAQCRQHGETADIAARRADVDRIYSEGATERGLEVARERGVTYVYLGREEAQQFGPDVTERFAGWPVRFERDGVRIVEVPR